MRSVKSLVAAGAASLFSTMAFAADMAIAPPPMSYAPPPIEDFGGWYLRGDIGFSNQHVKNVLDTNSAAYNNVAVSQTSGFGSAGIFDLGVGYRFNNWLRVDVTGQYRGNSNFTGLDTVTGTGPLAGFVGTDSYTATKSEAVFLVNAYADLGTWWCVTPFIGAGIGTSRVSIANFTDPVTLSSQVILLLKHTASTMPARRRSGTSPGRCMRVLRIRSARALRSNSPIPISTSAWA